MSASPLIHPAPGVTPARGSFDQESFARLVRWISQAGGKVGPLALLRSASSGRGVHAATHIPAGALVLQVPQRCMLTADAARTSAIGREIVAAGIEPTNSHTWLAAYLLQAGRRPFAVDKYEDPTTTVNRLVTALRDGGMDIDFPPLKLRAAHGEPVVKALNFLADAALSARGFRWAKPLHADEP